MSFCPTSFGLQSLPVIISNHYSHEQIATAFIFECVVQWASQGILQHFGPTGDFSAPSLATIKRFHQIVQSVLLLEGSFIHLHSCVSFIDTQITQGKTVYIHCKAGRGRSALIAIAFLLQNRRWELKQAIKFVTSKRPHIKLHAKQLQRLKEFKAVISSLNTE
uniref:Uncharacterized protein AlNc14C5G681 n=1 Tax=Albugo laibachii Nc14 TaxID=890382 RepID=F0W0P6_9STRA|nr:conserved hypothetical protein [Albugo laibachii Nc14]|eukprot:CCA14620.1 conserved hypothetical protein [Albugo laibachii Nc14]